MDRRGATILLAAILTAVLFAAVATNGSVQYVEGAPSFARRPVEQTTAATIPPVETVEIELSEREPFEIPGVVTLILRVLMWACVAALAVLLAVWAWKNRPSLRWRRRRRAKPFAELDDVAAAIAADAAQQRAVLSRGEARNAIVECWLRLERAVADAGVRPNPADTSVEFTERVLTRYAVDPASIRDLAGLYREARFSTHTMGEAARAEAIAALDAVHEGLRRAVRAEAAETDEAAATTSVATSAGPRR